jgi:hypothetical protein
MVTSATKSALSQGFGTNVEVGTFVNVASLVGTTVLGGVMEGKGALVAGTAAPGMGVAGTNDLGVSVLIGGNVFADDAPAACVRNTSTVWAADVRTASASDNEFPNGRLQDVKRRRESKKRWVIFSRCGIGLLLIFGRKISRKCF